METCIIKSGSSSAEILQKGAYLKSLSLNGIQILKPSMDETMTHGGCAVLLPYAGRIRNGTYTYQGKKYLLPKNDEGNAIHGFLKDALMKISRKSASAVELQTPLVHQGYPSALDVEIKYEIFESVLSVKCKVTNVGNVEAPVSIGFHPYFLGAEWEISHECEVEKLEMVDKLFPDGKRNPYKFNGLKHGSEDQFDDCYCFPCGVTLKTESYRLKMSKENMSYVMVYNGKWAEERSVALEPYTSAPDAFNNGIGLIRLSQNDSYECGFTLELSEK